MRGRIAIFRLVHIPAQGQDRVKRRTVEALQYTRVRADVFVHFAVGPAASHNPPTELQLLREIKGFGVLATEAASSKEDPWHLGVMVCGPLSQQTKAQWDHFSVDYSE
jgi:hypothetical protein